MGKAFLLKIGDDATPRNYRTLAGLRIQNETIDEGALALEAGGIFLGSEAEAQLRSHALAGTSAAYELSFEDGQKQRGEFLVTRITYTGDYNGERSYQIAMSSIGKVVPA